MGQAMWHRYFAGLVSTGAPSADVSDFLERAGRADTLVHCRAVATQAQGLAERFGVSRERANLAALSHDLAAVVPLESAVDVAESLGLIPDPIERVAPVLLHGPIAAAVLGETLGIVDREILDAVRYHTTSRPVAGVLERLIFVADKIALDPTAPVRDFVPAVRAAARESLELAGFVYLDWGLIHGPQLGWTLHPNTSAAYTELKRAGFRVRGSGDPAEAGR